MYVFENCLFFTADGITFPATVANKSGGTNGKMRLWLVYVKILG